MAIEHDIRDHGETAAPGNHKAEQADMILRLFHRYLKTADPWAEFIGYDAFRETIGILRKECRNRKGNGLWYSQPDMEKRHALLQKGVIRERLIAAITESYLAKSGPQESSAGDDATVAGALCSYVRRAQELSDLVGREPENASDYLGKLIGSRNESTEFVLPAVKNYSDVLRNAARILGNDVGQILVTIDANPQVFDVISSGLERSLSIIEKLRAYIDSRSLYDQGRLSLDSLIEKFPREYALPLAFAEQKIPQEIELAGLLVNALKPFAGIMAHFREAQDVTWTSALEYIVPTLDEIAFMDSLVVPKTTMYFEKDRDKTVSQLKQKYSGFDIQNAKYNAEDYGISHHMDDETKQRKLNVLYELSLVANDISSIVDLQFFHTANVSGNHSKPYPSEAVSEPNLFSYLAAAEYLEIQNPPAFPLFKQFYGDIIPRLQAYNQHKYVAQLNRQENSA